MTNDDLKRFYQQNAEPEQNKDFVRYDKNGRIKAKAGVANDDVATVGQLGGAGGGKTIQDINISVGEETVTYDTTDGITVTAQGKVKYTDETEDDITTEYNLPLKAADDSISIDTNEAGNGLEIKATQTIPLLVGTQEKPINLATDLEDGKYYLLSGYIYKNDTEENFFRGSRLAIKYTPAGNIYIITVLNTDATSSGGYYDIMATSVYNVYKEDGRISNYTKYVQTSLFNGNKPITSAIQFYAPTASGTSGQILQSNGSTNAPTWIDMPKGQIQTLVYDNTTLADHITDILSHVNAENGGTLLSIGFKTSTASVLANGTKNTVASDGTNTVTTVSAAVLKPSTFYSFRAADINKTDDITSLTLNGPNGLDGCSSTNIDINYDASTVPTPTTLCQASGCSTNLVDGNIETTIFKGVNLLNIPLEHLVIDYFTN